MLCGEEKTEGACGLSMVRRSMGIGIVRMSGSRGSKLVLRKGVRVQLFIKNYMTGNISLTIGGEAQITFIV